MRNLIDIYAKSSTDTNESYIILAEHITGMLSDIDMAGSNQYHEEAKARFVNICANMEIFITKTLKILASKQDEAIALLNDIAQRTQKSKEEYKNFTETTMPQLQCKKAKLQELTESLRDMKLREESSIEELEEQAVAILKGQREALEHSAEILKEATDYKKAIKTLSERQKQLSAMESCFISNINESERTDLDGLKSNIEESIQRYEAIISLIHDRVDVEYNKTETSGIRRETRK